MLKSLGQHIRRLRKEKGLTLIEIANKTGIAQATLSRIETGTMTGTLESHEKIAEILGVGLADLYSDVDRRHEQIAHLKEGADRKVTKQGPQARVELLTSGTSKKKITPLLLTLQGSGETQREENERGVEKFVYPLEGEIKVVLDKEEYPLGPGESLYFDASLPHKIVNTKSKTARVFLAVSPSKI